VMTGADLPALVGTAPSNIVAFKFGLVGGSPVWTQVPVQVGEIHASIVTAVVDSSRR